MEKIWVVGAKNNKTGNIRIDVFKTTTSEDMKMLIFNNIKDHNNIITNGWLSYRFLDDINSQYRHEIHVHGPNGNFGFG